MSELYNLCTCDNLPICLNIAFDSYIGPFGVPMYENLHLDSC